MADRLSLKTVMDTYGHTRALKAGELASPRIQLEFVQTRFVQDAFRPMVEELTYDVSEMAILTYLLARALGKEVELLPVVLLNRVRLYSAVYNADSGIREPSDLEGRRVGVRRYSQVTGTWVRGVLQHDYGVDLDKVEWVTQEGAHLAEHRNPSNVVASTSGESLEAMLLSREVDAAIVGRARALAPQIKPLLPDAARLEREWAERVGSLPVNHLICVKRELLEHEPWVAQELLGLLKRGKDRYLTELRDGGAERNADQQLELDLLQQGIDPLPLGVEAVRPGLELILKFAFEQHLIPRQYEVCELLDPRQKVSAS